MVIFSFSIADSNTPLLQRIFGRGITTDCRGDGSSRSVHRKFKIPSSENQILGHQIS